MSQSGRYYAGEAGLWEAIRQRNDDELRQRQIEVAPITSACAPALTLATMRRSTMPATSKPCLTAICSNGILATTCEYWHIYILLIRA